MNRGQRSAHRLLWPVLALIMAGTIAAALAAKAGVDRAAQDPPAVETR